MWKGRSVLGRKESSLRLRHQESFPVKTGDPLWTVVDLCVTVSTFPTPQTMTVHHPSPVTTTSCGTIRVVSGFCFWVSRVLQSSLLRLFRTGYRRYDVRSPRVRAWVLKFTSVALEKWLVNWSQNGREGKPPFLTILKNFMTTLQIVCRVKIHSLYSDINRRRLL